MSYILITVYHDGSVEHRDLPHDYCKATKLVRDTQERDEVSFACAVYVPGAEDGHNGSVIVRTGTEVWPTYHTYEPLAANPHLPVIMERHWPGKLRSAHIQNSPKE